MRRKLSLLLCMIVVAAFFVTLWTENLVSKSKTLRLQEDIVSSAEYREQNVVGNMFEFIEKTKKPGEYIGIYLLETKYGYQGFEYSYTTDSFQKLKEKWQKAEGWESYIETTKAIWNDVKYFPVPEFTNQKNLTVSYVNTWMSERSYGGKRGHEGTDIMAGENKRGLYPVISMTDGVVTKKGWLEKGGYRIGVTTASGVYFYYAHLDSYADIQEGDSVQAGDILGFMGDSGYGKEGTVGQFAVHLHLGIYIYPNGKEVSINPYWVLRYIENRKVKCYTEI